jgi:hypothetical protein
LFNYYFFISGLHDLFHQHGGNVGYSCIHVCTNNGHVLFGQPLRMDTVSLFPFFRETEFLVQDAGWIALPDFSPIISLQANDAFWC